MLPEKFNVLGTPEQLAAGAEPLDGPTLAWARALAGELGIWLVAGSIVERARRRAPAQHLGAGVARRATTSPSTARSTCSTSRSRASPTASRMSRRRATRSWSRDAGGADARAGGLLRPAVPRAVPDHGGAGRARVLAAGGVHGPDRQGPLGGAGAGSRDREPGLRAGRRAGRAASGRSRELRPFDDRRPLGDACSAPAGDELEARGGGGPRPRRAGPDPRQAPVARQPPAGRLPLAGAGGSSADERAPERRTPSTSGG